MHVASEGGDGCSAMTRKPMKYHKEYRLLCFHIPEVGGDGFVEGEIERPPRDPPDTLLNGEHR